MLYHRVGQRDGSYMDRYTVSPEVFARQMQQLSEEGWAPESLEDLVRSRFRNARRKTVAITFDDGFASNREFAWPILRRYGFPSATFIVTACVGQNNRWDAPDVAVWPLLSADELAAAEGPLMTFQSHGATHAHLTHLAGDGARLKRELVTSRQELQDMGVSEPQLFAYPFGTWDWRSAAAVKQAGYIGACTCMDGLNRPATEPFLLRRVAIEEEDLGRRLRLKLRTGRDLTRWPPARPPEIKRAGEHYRRKRDELKAWWRGFRT